MTHTDIRLINRIKADIESEIQKHRDQLNLAENGFTRGRIDGLELALTYFSELCA